MAGPAPEPARFPGRHASTLVAALIVAAAGCAPGQPPAESDPLAGLEQWNDGLAEICYYDATTKIYGKTRKYTRVHTLNRQWLDPHTAIKQEPADPRTGLAVMKLNVAEQIPTENYNYRYLTTLFVARHDLTPIKLVVSSQEWCGTTFKHFRWNDGTLHARTFSYFPGEGELEWTRSGSAYPYEALFVRARSLAATGGKLELAVLPSLRSNRAVPPDPKRATLSVASTSESLSIPAGRFEAVRVLLDLGSSRETFWIERDPPYRLLKHEGAHGDSLVLRGCERRAYWNRDRPSRYYAPGHAP